MGLLLRGSTVVSPARRANAGDDPFAKMYNGHYPTTWGAGLSAAGINVTPELSLTLSAMYSGLTRIGGDFMRMPAHIQKVRDDGGKDRVRGGPNAVGIGALAYRLRWEPNVVQTAAEFFGCIAAQYVMRNRWYAEIQPGPSGFADQLLPRHPDRVVEERLPSGRLKFKIIEPSGKPRTVTQDEMVWAHDTASGGFDTLTRTQFGAQAIGTSLAAEQAAGRFFKTGMNPAVMVNYSGDMDEEDEPELHASISRFAAGKENNFGILLVPADIKVSALGLEPEKAQMMLARQFGVREVARLLGMPPELLFADNTGVQTGRTWEEVKAEYITGCLGRMVVMFEQAMQKSLILQKDIFVIELLMDALFRGDLKSRADYYQKALEGPWMWPSEIRVKEGENPDAELDAIAAKRHRPADPKGSQPPPRKQRDDEDDTQARRAGAFSRGDHRFHMLLHDNAVRVLRRERAAVDKLAKKHASDVDGWKSGLQEFFRDHAAFVSETMRLDIRTARSYCAQHGTELLAQGVVVYDESWERRESDELVTLALDDQAVAA